MVRKLTGVLVALGVLYSSAVGALGLGELSLDSYLNEPFKAQVELLNVGNLGEDQVRVQLASGADFKRAGIEREYILTSLSFEIQLDESGSGVLFISTSQKVQEPYLNFIVEARWPTGRILREYTVLLDPPVFTENTPAVVTEVGRGNMRGESESFLPENRTATRESTSPIQGGREAAQVAGGSTHRVNPDETLWAIAARVRPEGVSTHQTMLSIQKLNPGAFIGGNINQLKSGSVLRLPLNDQLVEENFAAAVAKVAEHHRRWQQNLTGELDSGERPVEQIDAVGNDGSANIDGEVDQGPTLKIATVDDGQGEGVEALQSEVVANLENLERAQRSNADLQMRLDAMDEQINTLQRLLALKDEQIAALNEAVQGRTDIAPAEEFEGELLEFEAETTGEAESAGPVVIAEPEATKPEPPAVIAVPVEEPITTSPSMMDQLLANLPYIGALLVLLAAGIGYGYYRYKGTRSTKASEDDSKTDNDEFAGLELGDEDLIVDHFANDGEDQEVVSGARFAQQLSNYDGDTSVGYAAQVETGDVLSEADIYIAYGRFPQAVDLLTEALVQDPANIEARLKLVEVDVEVGDADAFKQEYANLQAIGDETALARASALLEGFDGGEEWLEALPECNLAEEELAAARSGPKASEMDGSVDAQSDAADVNTEVESVDEEMLSIDLAIDEAPEDNVDDMSLLDEPLIEGSEELLADEIDVNSNEPPAELELDIDDTLLGDLDGSEEELGLELEIAAEELELGSDTEDDGLEFDIDGALETPDDESEIDLLLDENELEEGPDRDFDFEELEMGDIAEDDTTELSLDMVDGDDLGDFDFSDMEIDDPGGDASQSDQGGELELPELDLPDVSDVPGFEGGDSESLDSILSVDNDEVNTKLDLARAYIDMGDAQGARDIIEEVLEEGSDEQLQQANKLLERLD